MLAPLALVDIPISLSCLRLCRSDGALVVFKGVFGEPLHSAVKTPCQVVEKYTKPSFCERQMANRQIAAHHRHEVRGLILAFYRPPMEETKRGHGYYDGGDIVSVGAGVVGDIDPVAASTSAASAAAVAAHDDGGLDYRALIRQQRRELEELKRAAREDSPRT